MFLMTICQISIILKYDFITNWIINSLCWIPEKATSLRQNDEWKGTYYWDQSFPTQSTLKICSNYFKKRNLSLMPYLLLVLMILCMNIRSSSVSTIWQNSIFQARYSAWQSMTCWAYLEPDLSSLPVAGNVPLYSRRSMALCLIVLYWTQPQSGAVTRGPCCHTAASCGSTGIGDSTRMYMGITMFERYHLWNIFQFELPKAPHQSFSL